MTSPLPVNLDTTHADDGGDASVKAHQQHHDTLHGFFNNSYPRPQPRTAGQWIYAEGYIDGGGVVTAIGRKYITPYFFPAALTLDQFTLNISTASASSVLELYQYSFSGSTLTRVGTGPIGTVTGDTTGLKVGTITTPISVQPGWGTWFLIRVTVAAARFTYHYTLTNTPPIGSTNSTISSGIEDAVSANPAEATYTVTSLSTAVAPRLTFRVA